MPGGKEPNIRPKRPAQAVIDMAHNDSYDAQGYGYGHTDTYGRFDNTENVIMGVFLSVAMLLCCWARPNPSSFVRFLPVSRYLLELSSGVWVLECGVLTSRGA